MQKRTLGSTGLEVSEIGLGTWAFASQDNAGKTQEDASRIVNAALEAGITVYDTSPLYGTAERDGIAEEVLGRALGKRREEVVVMTKFGRRSSASGTEFSAAGVRRSVEESLKRLGTDHLDVLFFHSPYGADDVEDDVWAELNRLRQEGKATVVGHSIAKFQETKDLALEWARERNVGVVRVAMNLLNREAGEFIETMHDLGVGVVVRDPLANGFLSAKVTGDTEVIGDDPNSRYSPEEASERAGQVQRLEFLVRDAIGSMSQAGLRWVLDHPGVSTVLTRASNAGEVAEYAAASDLEPYSADEMEKAKALHIREFPGP